MEISSSHHHQEFCKPMPNQALEEVLGGCHQTQQQHQEQQQERKPRPQQEQTLNCPRCNSTNTKFCYYNNYSLSQPRYFCKGCRRYWTQGGTLRNVPVGGGCRKNHKRSSSSSSKKPPQDQAVTTTSNNPISHLPLMLPPLSYDPSDLTLAFARLHKQPITNFRQLGLDGHHEPLFLGNHNPNSNPNSTHMPIAPTGFLDIFKSGFLDSTTTTTTTVANHGFHNLYHGFGGGGSMEEELEGVGLQFDGSLGGQTSVGGHGSSCKAMDEGENKVLMGLQWQMDGDGSMGVDSSREYYSSGVAASNWHGLINSSLM